MGNTEPSANIGADIILSSNMDLTDRKQLYGLRIEECTDLFKDIADINNLGGLSNFIISLGVDDSNNVDANNEADVKNSVKEYLEVLRRKYIYNYILYTDLNNNPVPIASINEISDEKKAAVQLPESYERARDNKYLFPLKN